MPVVMVVVFLPAIEQHFIRVIVVNDGKFKVTRTTPIGNSHRGDLPSEAKNDLIEFVYGDMVIVGCPYLTNIDMPCWDSQGCPLQRTPLTDDVLNSGDVVDEVNGNHRMPPTSEM